MSSSPHEGDAGWTLVPADQISGVAINGVARVTLGELRIAMVRTASGWHAFEDACPHEGAPLSDGFVVNDRLTCSHHGWCWTLNEPDPGFLPSPKRYLVSEWADGLWIDLTN